MFPKRSQIIAGTGWCVLDGACYMVTTLFFWKVNRDWSTYFLIVFAVNVFSLVGTCFLPESPYILHRLRKDGEAMESLQRIAKCNGKHMMLAEGYGATSTLLLNQSGVSESLLVVLDKESECSEGGGASARDRP